MLQLGYPRYQNNPLCKTIVWCRIQSYFKDLPKENCAKWEKSPSCFILQNKPNWKYLKYLAGKEKEGKKIKKEKKPCNHCSFNATFSVLMFLGSRIYLTQILFQYLQIIRNSKMIAEKNLKKQIFSLIKRHSVHSILSALKKHNHPP